jgi:hypothetical protein
MATPRPSIPQAIKDHVLVEAGHRCAVCGREAALEFAHIIPWSKTRDHSPENILVMCATCHSRADRENWSTNTLREYKKRPWNQRQKLDRQLVTIRIPNVDLDRFGQDAEGALLLSLATLLGVPVSEISVVTKERGSILVTIDLPSQAAVALLQRIDHNDLELAAILVAVCLLITPQTTSLVPKPTSKPPSRTRRVTHRRYTIKIAAHDGWVLESVLSRAKEFPFKILSATMQKLELILEVEAETTGPRSVSRFSRVLSEQVLDANIMIMRVKDK